jgi:hypothetical protein
MTCPEKLTGKIRNKSQGQSHKSINDNDAAGKRNGQKNAFPS